MRASGIQVIFPISVELSLLTTEYVKSLLPASTLTKLAIHNVVAVDTACANRSCESKYTYIVGAYYIDANGTPMAFWANRKGTDELWLTAQWNIRINNQPVAGGNIFHMLNSFHDFTDNRQIVYSTGHTAN